MSDYLQVILLGVIQGISEFLPISSDGHLAIAQELFARITGKPWTDPLELTIVLHAGTLAAVAVVFWQEIKRLLTQDQRVIGPILVGTLPVVVSGLLMKLFLEDYLTSPLLTGVMLIVTGVMLLWAGQQPRGLTEYQEIDLKQAWIIGLFQALAPLPGLSRSGCTISAGLWQGLTPGAAATFSFLLSLPAVAGACLVELLKIVKAGESATPP
ncbi:MAG: undecaprenyl-diphosphate phosphatase, partial [Planctomycetaceae bacterium]|nr:undecaprenyl-diphosphate phosphatase [Planctomycetaceae bacterium]